MSMNERNEKKRSGVLLALSSLPSPYGIGSLGKPAFEFADFLHSCGCSIWQILPLCVTSYGDSPYQSPSAKGLNYYFIDLDILCEKGLLTKEEISARTENGDGRFVDYGYLFQNRLPLLEKAFSRFDKEDSRFLDFVKTGKYHDFAFYMTLKKAHGFKPWYLWEDGCREYSEQLEERVLSERKDTYLFFQWTQYEFLEQFRALKVHLAGLGIQLMGDLPLYLSYDSVECYKYPELFQLDDKHNPTVVAGCPPDYFSPKGQLWGNPIYDWNYLKKTKYHFFNDRIRYALTFFDILRLDHFRGFSAYYAIPFGREDAVIGKWVKGPGMDFFQDKKSLPIVAEDLGQLDQDVYDLLEETTYPGMKVVEFGMDGDLENEHFPENLPVKCFGYSGTHDNMPLMGYLRELDKKGKEAYRLSAKELVENFGLSSRLETDRDLAKVTLEALFASDAETVIAPLQDLLFLGKESRMNMPSVLSGNNWTYRAVDGDFSPALKDFLVHLRSLGKGRDGD